MALGTGEDPALQQQNGSPIPAPGTQIISTSFNGKFSQQQDFLFVVDNSGSMSQEITSAIEGVDAFVSTLNSRRVVDYQVSVAVTDQRYYQGELIASNSGVTVVNGSRTPSAVSEWKSILSNIRRSPTDAFEMGLRAAELSIRRHGAQMLRAGVPLGIILLSDEEDQSSGPAPTESSFGSGGALLSTDHYVQWLRALGTSVQLFPIVGDRSDPCATVTSYGDRYRAVFDTFASGAFGSICQASVADSLARVAARIAERGTCFSLPRRPTGRSVSVVIDGVPISEGAAGYQLDKAASLLCFADAYLAREGTRINVQYEAYE